MDHVAFGSGLRDVQYDGVVSIEMRSQAAGSNADRVVAAVAIARSAYSD